MKNKRRFVQSLQTLIAETRNNFEITPESRIGYLASLVDILVGCLSINEDSITDDELRDQFILLHKNYEIYIKAYNVLLESISSSKGKYENMIKELNSLVDELKEKIEIQGYILIDAESQEKVKAIINENNELKYTNENLRKQINSLVTGKNDNQQMSMLVIKNNDLEKVNGSLEMQVRGLQLQLRECGEKPKGQFGPTSQFKRQQERVKGGVKIGKKLDYAVIARTFEVLGWTPYMIAKQYGYSQQGVINALKTMGKWVDREKGNQYTNQQ